MTAWPPRRVQLVDGAIVALILAVQLGGTRVAARHQSGVRTLDALAYLLMAAATLALLGRRRWPIPTLGAVYAFTFGYRMADYPQGPVWLALIVAFCTAVQTGRRWVGWATVAAGYLGLLWAPALAGLAPAPRTGFAVAVATWLLVLLMAAEAYRQYRGRRAEAVLARAAEDRRLVSDERLRIARELHDVLAHNISLINVQAGVALHLLETHPEQGRTALQTIKTASKETLTELRSVLGVLRQVDEDAPRAPAPSMPRPDELVQDSRGRGLRVRTEVTGPPKTLPSGVDLAAYRIVQEALTNVSKHAAGAGVVVGLAYGERDLRITVDDDGGTVGQPGIPGSGNGIAGMTERAGALGGSLRAGPRPGRGFRVEATLPLQLKGTTRS